MTVMDRLFAGLCAPPPRAHELFEALRMRGVREVRELEATRAERPLFGFEERCLRRSRSLVQEMEEQIQALRDSPSGSTN